MAMSLVLLLVTTACHEAPKVGAAQPPSVACPCAARASGASSSGAEAATTREGGIAGSLQEEQVEEDERVSVQLAVFGIAVTMAVIGILGYLLRRSLGLDPLPPPEDEASHH
jgi:hypothetical protein